MNVSGCNLLAWSVQNDAAGNSKCSRALSPPRPQTIANCDAFKRNIIYPPMEPTKIARNHIFPLKNLEICTLKIPNTLGERTKTVLNYVKFWIRSIQNQRNSSKNWKITKRTSTKFQSTISNAPKLDQNVKNTEKSKRYTLGCIFCACDIGIHVFSCSFCVEFARVLYIFCMFFDIFPEQSNIGNRKNERILMHFGTSRVGVYFLRLRDRNAWFFVFILRRFWTRFGSILHDFWHYSLAK